MVLHTRPNRRYRNRVPGGGRCSSPGCDAITRNHTKPAQHGSQLARPQAQRGIVWCGRGAPSGAARNHFAIAMMARGMLQNGGNQQFMTLHQAMHAPFPSKAIPIEAQAC